ncbi:MAG: hypothetical protein IKZ49_03565 [Alphaproteobacteria bacterium]|nr:hypothetical protein [Alphaproteobacteria bacterium]
MNKSDIEKEFGQVGLIRLGMRKNTPFIPISLQGFNPIKLKWRKLLTDIGHFFDLCEYKEYEYKYNHEYGLWLNILHYATIADTFTTEEIRYIFGKQGEQKLEEMTAIGYLNKGFPSQITEKQWKEFTTRKR